MNNVNGDLYILLDEIIGQLTDIREEMKTSIKNGARIDYPNKYGTIAVNDKERKDYSKEEKDILEQYAQIKGFKKQVTCKFKEVKATASTTAKNQATKYANNILEDIISNGAKNIGVALSALHK